MAAKARKLKEIPVERVQLGIRMEKRMVQVLKGTVAFGERSLGQLLEEIVLHMFEPIRGKEGQQCASPFFKKTLKAIEGLRNVYGMNYKVHDCYRFEDKNSKSVEERNLGWKAQLNCEKTGKIQIERVQLGARMERRMVQVLKGVAEFKDMSLGQLLEEIVLHSLSPVPNKRGEACWSPFDKNMLKAIKGLKEVYGMDYNTHACYRWKDSVEKSI